MAGTPPRRRRHGAAEQHATPAGVSPRNRRRARRRLEKEIKPKENAIWKARRRKPTWAAPKVKAVVAAAPEEEGMSLSLVPALTYATHVTTTALQTCWSLGKDRRIGDAEGRREISALVRAGIHVLLLLLLLKRDHIQPDLYILSSGRYDPGPSLHERFWPQSRQPVGTGRNFQLTEDDLLCAARAVLPVANSFISTSQAPSYLPHK